MKKLCFLTVAIVVLLNSVCAFAESYAEVTASSLNIREGAGTGYKVIASVEKGEKLVVIDSSAQNGWYSVKTQDGIIEGYASSKYLKIVEQSENKEKPWSDGMIISIIWVPIIVVGLLVWLFGKRGDGISGGEPPCALSGGSGCM